MKKASTFAKAVTTAGGDAYGLTLKLLIAGVVASGGVMVGCHKFVQDKVMTDPECVDPRAAKKSKTKVSFVEELFLQTRVHFWCRFVGLILNCAQSARLIQKQTSRNDLLSSIASSTNNFWTDLSDLIELDQDVN